MMLTLPSPAKINLFLHVTGQRPDGMHNIETLFQFLDFSDTLHIKSTDNTDIVLMDDIEGLPAQSNLIVRAARALQSLAGVTQGAHIQLEKRIPMGAGLGGGSSNAATTLLALNHLWGSPLSDEALIELACKLGADIPIFLHGHSAFATGVGNIFTDQWPKESPIVLVFSPESISTTEIFQSKDLTRKTPPIRIGALGLAKTKNDMEDVVRAKSPVVAGALDWLGSFGEARMSGTGHAVFSFFDTKAIASKIVDECSEPYQALSCQSCNKSPLVAAAQVHGIHFSHWGVAKR